VRDDRLHLTLHPRHVRVDADRAQVRARRRQCRVQRDGLREARLAFVPLLVAFGDQVQVVAGAARRPQAVEERRAHEHDPQPGTAPIAFDDDVTARSRPAPSTSIG
jgi:hypothetical protein